MFQFIKKANRGQVGGSLRFLILLMSVLVIIGCTNKGCSSSSTNDTSQESGERSLPAAAVIGPDVAAVGERVNFTMLHLHTSQVDMMIWTPPQGATKFQFPDPDRQPEPGGPPYRFRNVSAGEFIRVSFQVPPLPPGDTHAVHTVRLQDDGRERTTSHRFTVWEGRTSISTAPPALPRQTTTTLPKDVHIQQVVDLWRVHHQFDIFETEMTTSLCQDWFDALQTGRAFVAVQMPMTTLTPTQAYALPVVFQQDHFPTMSLVQHPDTTVLTAPLEYRPERFTFLENKLPAGQPGEHWMALGLASSTASCPPGLEIAADEWHLEVVAWLDMSEHPNNCEYCTLKIYYCYEGEENPLGGGAAALALLASKAGPASYQGEGITCIGPQFVPLREEGTVEIHGAATVAVSATQPISFHHFILVDGPMDVDIDYASTLESEWLIYLDDGEGNPDLDNPITPPISVTLTQNLWLATVVPTDTAAGPHTLIITASSVISPEIFERTSDLMWVGEWVAPAPAWCAALTGTTIAGATDGAMGAHTFTASAAPPTVTTPITYVWEASGQTPVTHTYRGPTDTVVFTWNIAGPQAITVRVANGCGGVVSDTHTITIGDACTPVDDVLVSGPPTSTVDVATVFTATAAPPGATTPVAYTWEASGQEPVTHVDKGLSDAAVFTWNAAGSRTITVTAANGCSVVSNTRVITIKTAPPGCPHPLEGVSIEGQTSGYTGTLYAFAAIITPPDVTEPITYTWSPEPESEQGEASAKYRWNTLGEHIVTLTAENCMPPHTVAVSDTHTITIQAGGQHHIYLPLVLRGFGGTVRSSVEEPVILPDQRAGQRPRSRRRYGKHR